MTHEDQPWRPLVRRSAWVAAVSIGVFLVMVAVDWWLPPIPRRFVPWVARLVSVDVVLAFDATVICAWAWLSRPVWRPVRQAAVVAMALAIPSTTLLDGLGDSLPERALEFLATVPVIGAAAVMSAVIAHLMGRPSLHLLNWWMRRRVGADLDTWAADRLSRQNRLQVVAFTLVFTGVLLLLASTFTWPEVAARRGAFAAFVAVLVRAKLIFDGLGVGAITSGTVMWFQATPEMQSDAAVAPTPVVDARPPTLVLGAAAAGGAALR